MEQQKQAAVITGDIIQSSLLGSGERKKMLATLQEVVAEGNRIFPDWNAEIFQGDSFQGSTLLGLKDSLRYAIGSVARLREQEIGIRIAIGIGEISYAAPSVRTSDGTAFLRSGRTLDELKKKNGTFIGIKTGNEDLDAEFEAHCASLDFLLARCTAPQAEALILAMDNFTQVQIAEKLHIAQPTVQQRLKSAGWPVFKAILQRFASKY
jgi:SatD family (SatD)